MRRLPLALRVLVGAAGGMLFLVLPDALTHLGRNLDWRPLLALAAVTVLDTVRIDVFHHRDSQDHSFFTLGPLGLFALLPLYGPDWAVTATALHSLLPCLLSRQPWYRTVYNTGLATGAMWAAAGIAAWSDRTASPGWEPILTALAAAAYVALHSGGAALALSLSSHRPMVDLWRRHMAWGTLQELVLAITGVALGRAVAQLGWTALLLAGPVVLLRASYQSYMRSQEEHTEELERFANQLITTLAAVVDARDAYTFGHSTQVARYAVAMGEQLGYSPEQLERLRVGALLHDIGKVGIPEAILFKPTKLEPWEYELMKEHTTIGYRIVSQIDRLRYAADIIHQHHEWYNGHGYPQGLRGDQILKDARIVGVADALESIMSDRPYRKGRSLEEALAEIRRWSGIQFDPEVVRSLERVVEKYGPSYFVNSAHLVNETHTGVMAIARYRSHPTGGEVAATAHSGSGG